MKFFLSRWFLLSLNMIFISYSFASDITSSRSVVSIDSGDYRTIRSELAQEDRDLLDVISIDSARNAVHVLTTDDGLRLLENAGISWSIVKTSTDLRDDRIDSQYLDYSEVTAQLLTYENTYPTRAKRYELAATAEGRRVWAMKISDNVTSQEDEPEILVIGLHQAREIMSTEVCMDMINFLLTNYGSNPDVTQWVNSWQIWIVPMLNPDGSAYCWATDQYWTKNRRDNGGGVYGVDLGHNYPLDWGACFGSASDPNSNSYRGPSAASEPEIQALITLGQNHHFDLVLSYQSFDEFVLGPYGCYGETPPDHSLVDYTGNQIASVIQKDSGSTGYAYGSWWNMLYSNDGNETDYFYAQFGSYAYAIEVNASSYYPAYSIRNQTVQRNRPGWQKALDSYETGTVVYGQVRDACTGEPMSARYWVDEFPLTSKETPRTSVASTGRYSSYMQSGRFNLRFQADGYIERIVPVTMGSTPINLNVDMIPTSEPGIVVWGVEIDDSTGDNDQQLDPGETANLRVVILAATTALTNISGTLSGSDTNITILDNAATWPNLGSGQAGMCSSNPFRVRASASAPEGYAATLNITFDTTEELCQPIATCIVNIRTYYPACPMWEETLDSNPGWTVTSYYPSGCSGSPGPYNNWEFGIPQVGPSGAYTGNYVYGTGLDSSYDNCWTLCLTTPPIDCSDLQDSVLKYARFLQIEDSYDSARVRIRNVSGGAWTNVWTTESSFGSWTPVTLDISNWADNQSSVEIRFDIVSDSSQSESGFYIDDIQICGNYAGAVPPQPTPTTRPPFTATPLPTGTSLPPTFTPTPPPNTPTASPSPTVPPGSPTNTPITPTHTPTIVPPTFTPTQAPASPTPTTPPGSPTYTAIPTHTPFPTFTPAPTFTSEPSHTPKPSQTPSNPTNTPNPSHTATVTPSPTPTGDFFSITLQINQTMFNAGDLFDLRHQIIRQGSAVTLDKYIILDVYGSYFFGPGWTQNLDFETQTFPDGYNQTLPILNFQWPEVSGHAGGLKFYAGCLYAGTVNLVGDISMVEFGY